MDGDIGGAPPSLGFALLLVAAPLVAGALLFLLFERARSTDSDRT